MALKTFVIVNDISNLSDARYCAGMGVNVLGFRFDSSEQEQSFQNFNEISSWIAGVPFSGIFDLENGYFIQEVAQQTSLDFWQVRDPEVLESLQHTDNRKILEVVIDESTTAESFTQMIDTYSDMVTYFVISNTDQTLNEHAFDWIRQNAEKHKLLIDFGFDADNVLENIETLGVAGICMKGSAEERPGFKDYGEIMDVLEALED